MNDLFAHARRHDPDTSKDAAKSVNVTKQERKVLSALRRHGPMTQEETAKKIGEALPAISPRFRPLLNKRRIAELLDIHGNVVTRKGDSGRQRKVYYFQPNPDLWLDKPPTYKTAADNIADLKNRAEEFRKLMTEILISQFSTQEEYAKVVNQIYNELFHGKETP